MNPQDISSCCGVYDGDDCKIKLHIFMLFVCYIPEMIETKIN